MFTSLASWRRRGTFATVVALLGTLVSVTLCVPATAAPVLTYTRNEPAVAVTSPSVVYLEATYTGYLRDTKTGRLRSPHPVVVLRRCSGVVVSAAGDVLTTTLCVQPADDIILVNALYRLGRDLITQGDVANNQLDAFVTSIRATSAFTGERAGSKPDVRVLGQFDVATPELTTEPAIPAAIVAALPTEGGNATLLRLQRAKLPVIEIDAAADPQPGDTLIAVGYGRASSPEQAGNYAIRTKTVTVTGRTASNRTGISADLGGDGRGGAVVDSAGRLVALLDTDANSPGNPAHDLITMLHLKKLLEQAAVTNQLTDVDRAYRDALAAYFDGRFSVAVTKFDGVLKQDPAHVAAQAYRGRAAQRLANEGDSVENQGAWLEYALSIVIGAGIVALIGAGTRYTRRFLPKAVSPPVRAAQAGPSVQVSARVGQDATVVLSRSDLAAQARPGPPPAVAPPPSRRDRDETVILPAVPKNDETVILPAVPKNDETVVLPAVPKNDETVVLPAVPKDDETVVLPRQALRQHAPDRRETARP
jgi:hypothetical protein